MPDPAGTKIVVNSLILGDLAVQVTEESSGEWPDPQTLLSVIRRRKHTICITDKIKEIYAETQSSGQYPELRGLLTPTIQQLDDMGIAKECGLGPMPHQNLLRGLQRQHFAFVEDALRTGAKYLLTVNPSWLKRRKVRDLVIMRSEEYIRRQGN